MSSTLSTAQLNPMHVSSQDRLDKQVRSNLAPPLRVHIWFYSGTVAYQLFMAPDGTSTGHVAKGAALVRPLASAAGWMRLDLRGALLRQAGAWVFSSPDLKGYWPDPPGKPSIFVLTSTNHQTKRQWIETCSDLERIGLEVVPVLGTGCPPCGGELLRATHGGKGETSSRLSRPDGKNTMTASRGK